MDLHACRQRGSNHRHRPDPRALSRGLAAGLALLAFTSAPALEPGAVLFNPDYALTTFDGLQGLLVGTNGFRLGGAAAESQLGSAVASCGDVNGDGFTDLLVSAPLFDVGPNFRAGRTYLVWGNQTFTPDQAINLASAMTIDGPTAEAKMGSALAGGGDFNGDGLADVAVSSPEAGNTGLVALVFGSTNLPSNLNVATLDGTNGFLLLGDQPGAQVGASVAFAGDINGDGRDELLVGAPGATPTGRVFVVYGSAQPPAALNLANLNGSNGCVLWGESANHSAGRCVAALGDFDGDGRLDVAVGAPNAGSSFEGRAYAVFGRTN